MLCKMGNISREDIGAIRIQKDVSQIEIRESAVKGFLNAVGPGMTMENGAKLVQIKGAPNLDRGPVKRKGGNTFAKGEKRAAPVAKGPATPIDWNDAPTPRKKKPKPGTQPTGGPKPKTKHAEDEPPKADKWKPRKAKDGSKAPKESSEKTRGPKPPAGKPSSKKNRARQLSRSTGGGDAKPVRKSGGKSGKPRNKG